MIIGIVLVATGSYFLFRFIVSQKTIQSVTATPGVTSDTIRIGTVKAITGPAAFLGTEYAIGEQTYINALNDAGGIFGRKIQLLSYDDQYDPQNTVYDTQQLLVKDNVFVLFDYVGTATGKKVLPMINETEVPLIGLLSGAKIFRDPLQPYIFNVRASYHEEAAKIVDYLVRTRTITKIAVLYQYDDFGFDALQGIEASLKTYGMAPIVSAPYERNTTDIEQALDTISATRPEAVILASVFEPGAKFIKQMHEKGLTPLFATMSFIGSDGFAQTLDTGSADIIVSQTMPFPGAQPDPNCPDGYEQLLAKYFPEKKPSWGTLEGFINAKILTEGLRRAGPGLTRQSLSDALESLADYPIGKKLHISLSHTDHQALHAVYLTRIAAGTFSPIETTTDPHDCIQL